MEQRTVHSSSPVQNVSSARRPRRKSPMFLCVSTSFWLLQSSILPVASFPLIQPNVRTIRHVMVVAASVAPEDSGYRVVDARSERFHSDLRRVLESRARTATQVPAQSVERRQRPPVWDSDHDGAERAYSMLQHMVDIGVATEESFAVVMQAFVKRGRNRWKSPENDMQIICAADQVEALLQQLQYQDRAIHMETYNLVLEAYANCATPRGDRNYAKRAAKLLESMEALDAWNVQSLAHVLHAWAWQQANLQSGECAQRANELLERIQEMTKDAPLLMQCYDWVLEAWSKSKTEGSPQKADDIFQRMKELKSAVTDTNSDNVVVISELPNAQSYSNAILAWSKCLEEYSVLRAHELLHEMVNRFNLGAFTSSEPELIAFNGVITAWARRGRPDKAEAILWLVDEFRGKCQGLVPDVLTYNAVLHAHVKSPDKNRALQKAISIVQHMEDQCKDQPAITPDSFTYNTLMKAWVQSGREDAAEHAETILCKIEGLAEKSPDAAYMTNRNFNVVINAYAKSNDRFAARKAYQLLRRMQSSKHIQPDIISYTSVMECYSKSADPNASIVAEELLQEAFDSYEANGEDPALMPNLRTFTMAIMALARCPRPGNAAKARVLLEQLVSLYERTGEEGLRPNAYPYNYVLNCAANTMGTTEEKIQAFQVATKTYQDMRQSTLVQPDSFTYAFWIKACNNLLPKAAELYIKCVTLAFEQCKKDGMVSPEVLTRLQQGGSPRLCQSLLDKESQGYRNLQVQDLPPSWSRNIGGTKRRNVRQSNRT